MPIGWPTRPHSAPPSDRRPEDISGRRSRRRTHSCRVSFRKAAYCVCSAQGRVLLARHATAGGETTWTLPGGRVEHAEDPFDAATRELGNRLRRGRRPMSSRRLARRYQHDDTHTRRSRRDAHL
ncbi:NUDIX hydrolase [Nocardia sp. NPDC127579]|uniref:NUDIX hydrolase n=1 Tax=Nocardia sp. NPDC127579 TaxID=3345402 RepID=UPI00362A751C